LFAWAGGELDELLAGLGAADEDCVELAGAPFEDEGSGLEDGAGFELELELPSPTRTGDPFGGVGPSARAWPGVPPSEIRGN
jgi:hypothetical protein